MNLLRNIATAAGLLAIGHAAIVAERRHQDLVDLLEEIADKAGIILALDDLHPDPDDSDTPEKPIPADATPAAPVAAVVYGPGTGKVAVIHADGGRTIHAAHGAKWAAVAQVARLVDDNDIDVDAIEAQLLADHRGVKELRFLPAKTLNRATTRLLDRLTTTPTGGTR